MDLTLSPEDARFRDEVRAFLRANLPADVARRTRKGFQPAREDQQAWHRILHAKGWAAPEWPAEYGGTGWTELQKFIYEVEYGLADAPDISVPGIHLVGPVICRFGSDHLRQTFLPQLLRGDWYFAQGFSEPSAGSDLANLRTRAVRDGDHYVVNGQKIWTSEAHFADYVFALVRTNPDVKPQAGLSMILIDLKSPGVSVRPIVTIDDCHHVNEVFFDNVRVPTSNLIGEPDKAWTYAKFLLDSERTYNAHIGRLLRRLRRVRELASTLEREHGTPALSPAQQDKLARLAFDIQALQWSVLRVLLGGLQGPALGAAASGLKVQGSHLLLRLSDLELEVMGPHGLPRFTPADGESAAALATQAPHDAPGLMAQYFYWRASTIFGGSNDVQRSIVWNALQKA